MLDFIKKLFRARTVPCPSCIVREPLIHIARGEAIAKGETIQALKDEIQYLRSERAQLQDLFNRALRLQATEPNTTQGHTPVHVAPMNSWGQARTALEKQHKKVVTPEDEKAAYWKNKSEQLAQEAGLPDQTKEGHAS